MESADELANGEQQLMEHMTAYSCGCLLNNMYYHKYVASAGSLKLCSPQHSGRTVMGVPTMLCWGQNGFHTSDV